jgi:hypothetical protein
MAIVVPSTDIKNYPNYVACTTLATAITNTSSGPHKAALQQRLVAAYAELIDGLMASGKLTSTNLFNVGTYGT